VKVCIDGVPLLIILIMIIVSLVGISISFASSRDVATYINWVRYINPSMYNDWATATCIYGDYIYVVGVARNSTQHTMIRIEKRYKYDGELEAWKVYGFGIPFECLFVDEKLYVVGANVSTPGIWQWLIIELDTDLNVLRSRTSIPSIGGGWAYSVDSDGEHLYIAGFGMSPTGMEWHVEKWRIDILSPVYAKSWKPSPEDSWAFGITYNNFTKQLWVVGYYYNPDVDNACWRIEILDTNLTHVKAINIDGLCGAGASTVVFDENGNGYVVGNGIALINSTGGRNWIY